MIVTKELYELDFYVLINSIKFRMFYFSGTAECYCLVVELWFILVKISHGKVISMEA